MDVIAHMTEFRRRMIDAAARNLHHDQRRAFLVDLLKDGYDIQPVDFELERGVTLPEVRGRIDLLYGRIVFEVKRDLDREQADVERELAKYLTQTGAGSVGIATDGLRFDSYRLDEAGVERFASLELADVDDATAVAWLDAYLFAQRTVVPTTDDVVRRFGPDSAVYLSARRELAEMWRSVRDEPAMRLKRQEWDGLLRMVYGSEKGSDDLFLRHTYLAVLARLFAYMALARKAPAPTDSAEVLTGRAFERLGVTNLAEDDFFTWISHGEVSRPGELLVGGMARHLSMYETDRIDEDLLKNLYETLVDPEDRHDLGEYYTPDWLAAYLLEQVDYAPGQRLLDPSCGSGTFLFSAVRRLRELGLTGSSLAEEAAANLVGFDVHPLAVTIARANFVLALGADAATTELTIPIWMADSLAVPADSFGRPIQVKVSEDGGLWKEHFVLPTEMEDVSSGLLREFVSTIADLADPSIPERDAEVGLMAKLTSAGASSFADAWVDNLMLLRRLVEEGRDTVWRFILSNAIQPQVVARQPCDVVIGNPPWLALRDIEDSAYQQRVLNIAVDHQLLESRRGWRGGALELATVFLCFSARHYLASDGVIGFVLPRGVLEGAKQHDRFRQGKVVPALEFDKALDLEGVKPLFNVPSCALVLRKPGASS